MNQAIDARQFLGKNAADLPTPCLTIHRDLFEANLQHMQDLVGQKQKNLRPHAKTHKCSQLARRQKESGAIGICAAKLSEAEVLAKNGVENILVTGPIVSAEAHQRLRACLAAGGSLMVALENLGNARKIAALAREAGRELDCLLDLDVGQGRTGISPDDAPALAAQLASLPGLKLCGVQAYAGHAQHIISLEERKRANTDSVSIACGIIRTLRSRGLDCPILSVGGTGSYEFDSGFAEVTEIQAGSYVFMDADYHAIELSAAQPFETALTLRTTVLSIRDGYAIVDAGLKALYRDGGVPRVLRPDLSGIRYDWFGDEYGRLDGEEAVQKLKAGDCVEVSVSHCDPTVNLFDCYFVIHEGRVCDVWDIDLRGCSQ